MSYFDSAFYFTQYGGSAEEIDDAMEVTVDRGMELRNNSLTIKLKNEIIDVFSDGNLKRRWHNNDKSLRFSAVKTTQSQVLKEEQIDVYAGISTTDPSFVVASDEYKLMSGIITTAEPKANMSENTITLKCQDRTAVILDKNTVPIPFRVEDEWTAPLIIQNIIRHAGANGGGNIGFDADGNTSLHYPYLIDARLFSEGIKSSGTTTSASTRRLINSGEDFIADGVAVGDMVRNTTDNTYAYVREIVSATELRLSANIFTSGEGYQVSDGFIQDTRPNGSSFPTLSFSQVNSPCIESINDLSQVGKTNSTSESEVALVIKRAMRWFIDSKNRFHWFVPENTPEHHYVFGATSAQDYDLIFHQIHSLEPVNESRDKKNFIIFKAGEDMNNIQIKGYYRAPFSGMPVVKDSYEEFLEIARQMKDEDLKAGNLTHTKSDEYDYPASYGGGVTPAWDRQRRSVSSDNDYNTNFIEEARLRAKERCQDIFQKFASPRWDCTIQVDGENVLPGDVVKLTSLPHGIDGVVMRIKQVTHSISPDGWFTSIKCEEDELEMQKGV